LTKDKKKYGDSSNTKTPWLKLVLGLMADEMVLWQND